MTLLYSGGYVARLPPRPLWVLRRLRGHKDTLYADNITAGKRAEFSGVASDDRSVFMVAKRLS